MENLTEEGYIDGEILIADFMMASLNLNHRRWIDNDINYVKYFDHELKYHSSWDWIMPVCKKFYYLTIPGKDGIQFMFRCQEMSNSINSFDTITIFEQMVENIKWYRS